MTTSTCAPKDAESNPSAGLKVIQRREFVDKYMLPRDAAEKERLTFQHYLLSSMFQHYLYRHEFHGNFSSPIEDALEGGINVIDVSCGVGIWTIEMAQDFPNSTFVGTDLVDMFPKHEIPENCSFVQANTLERLPFPDDTFDFTFQRLVQMAYSPADWATVIAELVRVTKPGGWIELFESDSLMHRPPKSYLKYQKAWLASTHSRGIDINIALNLGHLLEEALIDVKADYISFPVGWNGRAGELMGHNLELCRLALSPIIAPFMEMTTEDYEQWAMQISKELRMHRSYINGYYAYGRKPVKHGEAEVAN
ncbi:S-adenosyl-L-methionine-dependent methyltransferase [Endogone sp. FLAS-F59071]|nr:S-adenosyl-L-methionine-dependent methyltransferase [Endogone sp. FLAS-F59071]|eukprot:RUS22217.1 S-adenosyl-L-methionine-dependent methyltransferase [Endogone sp. FLAS-F59071]